MRAQVISAAQSPVRIPDKPLISFVYSTRKNSTFIVNALGVFALKFWEIWFSFRLTSNNFSKLFSAIFNQHEKNYLNDHPKYVLESVKQSD